ncbi:hypothetical protein [Salinarimonas sp.]|uniref:hypothetical protein n=1 Tax=Salinarimonas sp. TaxID=2766526 RepID=UPI0032D90F76
MITKVPDGKIYEKTGQSTVFLQLARKIEMDHVSNEAYYAWLDDEKAAVGRAVRGAQIAEKPDARENPPLNTAIYYDTEDMAILPTGALLRTSCNKITHAFCAFKGIEDEFGVRRDNRHVFDGDEKRTIQQDPSGAKAVSIVQALMARTDIDHPGRHLERETGISPLSLRPALLLDDLRYTFYVWLDERDCLRCSIDRAQVRSLREGFGNPEYVPVIEVEIAIYPRISDEVARDPRVAELIDHLTGSLVKRFDTRVTKMIKYQRAAKALGMW